MKVFLIYIFRVLFWEFIYLLYVIIFICGVVDVDSNASVELNDVGWNRNVGLHVVESNRSVGLDYNNTIDIIVGFYSIFIILKIRWKLRENSGKSPFIFCEPISQKGKI